MKINNEIYPFATERTPLLIHCCFHYLIGINALLVKYSIILSRESSNRPQQLLEQVGCTCATE